MRFRKKVITRREHTSAFETENILQTADLYRKEGKIYEAVNLYRQAKDYDRILSLDFTPLILEMMGDVSFGVLLKELSQCPVELKKKHLMSVLSIAWGLKIAALDDAFDLLMDALYPIINTQSEKPHLIGEWFLLSSFRHHPDSIKMASVLKEAEPYFKGNCSQIITPETAWLLSIYMPYSVYYTKTGEADRQIKEFKEYIILYSKLTGGHGCGSGALFHSMIAFQRGDIDNAEIYAYKAMYLAKNTHQNLVLLGVIQQMGLIALHKLDTAGWQNAIKLAEEAAGSLQDTDVSRVLYDITCAVLLNELQQVDHIADWLKNGDFSDRKLNPMLLPLAVFVHALYLMHQGEFARLVGFTESLHQLSLNCNPLLSALISLVTAAGYLQMKNLSRAKELIRHAAEAAIPDRLILPFASFSWCLKGLTDDLIEKEHQDLFKHFILVKKRFAAGWQKLYREITPEQLPSTLTGREYEVAMLASQGFHNIEIASKLNVSENTVRAHLRSTFQKLEVDRRAKLAEKLIIHDKK